MDIFHNYFVKLHGKKIVSHNMTMLYLNPSCMNIEVCYKETALYQDIQVQ